jgi:hypothetical protein
VTRLRAGREQDYPQLLLKSREVHTEKGLEQVAPTRTDGAGNGKGCDIGYVPAICSCEGANSVDARTVAALDAITAFADPNPNCSSQNQSVFSGLVAREVALPSRSLSLLRSGKVYFANPFSRRRQPN